MKLQLERKLIGRVMFLLGLNKIQQIEEILPMETLEEVVSMVIMKDLPLGKRKPTWLALSARKFLPDPRLLLKLMRESRRNSTEILFTNRQREMMVTL